MKTNDRDNLIVRMTKYWESIDKLYDKIMPMYRCGSKSIHRYDGTQSVIKRTEREISIMKSKASKTTRLYNHMRKKNKNTDILEIEE